MTFAEHLLVFAEHSYVFGRSRSVFDCNHMEAPEGKPYLARWRYTDREQGERKKTD